MISIARYFYRNGAPKVILLLVLFAAGLPAQQKKDAPGPRATALAVMSPDGKTPARLIPICIRDNGQFWDASVYQATPRPMALEPGTVYELERSGEPIGFFTISQAVQDKGSWVALGRWDSRQPGSPTAGPPSSDEDRPVLRRSKPSDQEPGGKPQPAQPEAAAPPTSPQEDSDRPMLKRGKPAPQPAPPSTPPPSAARSTKPAPAPAPASPAPPKPPQLVPAVSDAAGPEPHPYTIERNADDQVRLRRAISALAEQVILKQAGLAPGSIRLEYTQADLRIFDLDGNNSAEVVLSGHATATPIAPARGRHSPATPAAPPREFFVTLIGREDLNLELHTVYSRVIASRNLGIDGRLELIDAVDVDGDARGELLFRRTVGTDTTYLVLKVGLSQTTRLFDSAGE